MGAHDRQHRTDHPDEPEHVGVELDEHLVVAAFLDGPAQLDAGVVHADVDAPDALDHFGDRTLDGADVPYVEVHHLELEVLGLGGGAQRPGAIE